MYLQMYLLMYLSQHLFIYSFGSISIHNLVHSVQKQVYEVASALLEHVKFLDE